MPLVLPPSLRKDLHPVGDEVAEFRDMPLPKKLEILDTLCKDAVRLLGMRRLVGTNQVFEEPLPDSTREALRRLKSAHGR